MFGQVSSHDDDISIAGLSLLGIPHTGQQFRDRKEGFKIIKEGCSNDRNGPDSVELGRGFLNLQIRDEDPVLAKNRIRGSAL